MSSHRKWLGIALALFASTAANALVLSDNLDQTADRGRSMTGTFRLAGRFATDAQGSMLTSVTVLSLNTTAPGDIRLELFTDGSQKPAMKLGDLGLPSLGSESNGFRQVVFGGGGLALDPSTTYWVVGRSLTTSAWLETSTGTGSGSGFRSGDAVSFGNGWDPSSAVTPLMRVEVAPVPEPASMAALALGAATLLRRRQKRGIRGAGQPAPGARASA